MCSLKNKVYLVWVLYSSYRMDIFHKPIDQKENKMLGHKNISQL